MTTTNQPTPTVTHLQSKGTHYRIERDLTEDTWGGQVLQQTFTGLRSFEYAAQYVLARLFEHMEVLGYRDQALIEETKELKVLAWPKPKKVGKTKKPKSISQSVSC